MNGTAMDLIFLHYKMAAICLVPASRDTAHFKLLSRLEACTCRMLSCVMVGVVIG